MEIKSSFRVVSTELAENMKKLWQYFGILSLLILIGKKKESMTTKLRRLKLKETLKKINKK
jgi:hypothetical protein